MLQHYAFGRYFCELQADVHTDSWVNAWGRDFRCGEHSTGGIAWNLEKPSPVSAIVPEDAKDRWQHALRDGKHDVVYYSEGKAQFSFSYRDDARFSVAIPLKASRRNFQTGMQFAMLVGLAGKAFGFHGVTVICKDKVIILSAPSGTGKSTLGKLLHQYCDAAIINGDFALLTPEEDGSLMFEPTPFCGTSGICHNYRLKVDRIVFLEQAKENSFAALQPMQAVTRLLSNVFIPSWDGEKAMAVQQNALRAVTSVPMNVFAFEPTKEAAEMFHSLVT